MLKQLMRVFRRWLLRHRLERIYGEGAVERMDENQRQALAKIKPEDRSTVTWEKDDATFNRFAPRSEADAKELVDDLLVDAQLKRLVATGHGAGIAVEPRAADGLPPLAIPPPPSEADGRAVAYFAGQRHRISPTEFSEAYRLAYDANGERIAQVERIARPGNHAPVNALDGVPLLPDPNYEPVAAIENEKCPQCGMAREICRDCGPTGWRRWLTDQNQ